MHEITLRIRYRPGSKISEVSVQIEEDRISCEDLAWLFAEKTTEKYLDYVGAPKDKKFERRYRLGQYKMIRNIFEGKL